MSRVIVITGGAKGLGLHISQAAVSEGFNVIVVSRSSSSALEDLDPAKVRFIPYDFEDTAGVFDLASEIVRVAKEEFKSELYGLVNNSAIGNDGVLATMHDSEISKVLAVNVQSPILLTKYLSRNMLMKGVKGRIVNIGSIIGSTGYSGLSVYGASKAALEGFTRSLAREIGRVGITVNTVAPGFMETDMTSALGTQQLDSIKRRSASREFPDKNDVAAMVLYLMSDHGSSITGTTMTVDAGSTA